MGFHESLHVKTPALTLLCNFCEVYDDFLVASITPRSMYFNSICKIMSLLPYYWLFLLCDNSYVRLLLIIAWKWLGLMFDKVLLFSCFFILILFKHYAYHLTYFAKYIKKKQFSAVKMMIWGKDVMGQKGIIFFKDFTQLSKYWLCSLPLNRMPHRLYNPGYLM